ALYCGGRVAAILKLTASVERAKIYIVGPNDYPLLSCSKPEVKNPNARQMRHIFFQYPKRVRLGLESENFRVRKFFVKIENLSAYVATDVENEFRVHSRRHKILGFLSASEKNLIQRERVGAAGTVKDLSAAPAHMGQR